mmetsp:Transcript_529/g.1329  ORF Transcript_529/g.1329 Transcript_529/m.1329 type:complete len:235 (-) Transcript_529:55-759(-)
MPLPEERQVEAQQGGGAAHIPRAAPAAALGDAGAVATHGDVPAAERPAAGHLGRPPQLREALLHDAPPRGHLGRQGGRRRRLQGLGQPRRAARVPALDGDAAAPQEGHPHAAATEEAHDEARAHGLRRHGGAAALAPRAPARVRAGAGEDRAPARARGAQEAPAPARERRQRRRERGAQGQRRGGEKRQGGAAQGPPARPRGRLLLRRRPRRLGDEPDDAQDDDDAQPEFRPEP